MDNTADSIMVQVTAPASAWKEIRAVAQKHPGDVTVGAVEPVRDVSALSHLPFTPQEVKEAIEVGILVLKFSSAALAFVAALVKAKRAVVRNQEGDVLKPDQLQ